MPRTIKECRLTVGGVTTRALELDGEGPSLLLLHGYSDSADTWRPLLGELAKLGRGALAVDLPGFGQADSLVAGAILPQIDRFAAALIREAAGDDTKAPPLVVGNSLGAVTGLCAAQDPGLPLGGVVAISPAGFGHQPWVELAERTQSFTAW